MNKIRNSKVAGMFYPSDPTELRKLISSYLGEVKNTEKIEHVAGIVSPHAGYVYSGKTAAWAYKTIESAKYENVIVISPSHREYFKGVSIYPGNAYKTPLGEIQINKKLRQKMVEASDLIFEGIQGHGSEHALEVQLPFLQVILANFQLIPLVIGSQSRETVDELAKVLAEVVDDKTLIVASSDLSHFYSKSRANIIDSRVIESINYFKYDELQNDLEQKRCEACGGGGIVAMLKALKMKNYSHSKVIQRSDSGDVTGDEKEVVGYLSAIVYN